MGTDVLVSPSSVVTDCYEDVSLDSDWEFVEPQSFSSSKKRLIAWVENHEDMSYERGASKSTTDIQEEDDAAHGARTLQSRLCSGKLRWRHREPA